MPNKRTWPVVGLQRPIRRLNRVDFPAPLSPRIPVTPPEMAKLIDSAHEYDRRFSQRDRRPPRESSPEPVPKPVRGWPNLTEIRRLFPGHLHARHAVGQQVQESTFIATTETSDHVHGMS